MDRRLIVIALAVACAPASAPTITPTRAPTATVAPRVKASPVEGWPMFRADVERSGFSPGSVVGDQVERVWEIPSFNVTAYSAVKGSPAVVGGIVYCGTDTGRFVAARVHDGSIVWEVQVENAANGIHGSPAVVDDTVYIGAYNGTLYALDRHTGAQRWRRTIGFAVGASPAVVPAWGTVFSAHELPDGSGYIVAFDARTGTTKWQQRMAAHPHSSVAVDVGRARVFVGDNSGVVYAFDAHSGARRWRRTLERVDGKADVKTTPTVIPALGLLVVTAWSGKVIALDEDSGAVVWEHVTGRKLMGSTAYLASTRTVFAGVPSGRFIALDAATGTLRWEHDVGASIYSSPAISGDGRAVVFGASDGRVYALATSDGHRLWSIAIGGRVSGSPALAGRRIYVTAQHGSLWALETSESRREADVTIVEQAARALLHGSDPSTRDRAERVLIDHAVATKISTTEDRRQLRR